MIIAKSSAYADGVSVSLRDRLDRAHAYVGFEPSLHLAREIHFWVGSREIFVVERRGAKRYVEEPIYRPWGVTSYILTIKCWARATRTTSTTTYVFSSLSSLEGYLKGIR